MSKVTEYGKVLRHIRLDFSELLGTMARKLGVSSAYLSAIETGRRAIPVELSQKIIGIYELSNEYKENLLRAEAETNNSLTIDLANASKEKKELTVMFARELKDMSVKDVRDILKRIKKEGKI